MSEKSEIVQIPAVYKDGKEILWMPEWKSLRYDEIRDIAKGIGGVVGYKKVRATYTEIDQTLCTHYNCTAIAKPGTYDCGGPHGR